MLLLDVNVVLAGHREDHSHFASVRPWLDDLWESQEPFAVAHLVWWSFLRIATKRNVFNPPTSVAAAFAFVAAVRAQPGHVDVVLGPRHFGLLHEITSASDATGDLMLDAALVAIAMSSGATVATLDRDFARFPGRHMRPS